MKTHFRIVAIRRSDSQTIMPTRKFKKRKTAEVMAKTAWANGFRDAVVIECDDKTGDPIKRDLN